MTYSLLTRPDRLAALRHIALLDTPPEEGFDRLTRMASRLLGTPIALIAFISEDRQFFKSSIGLPEPWASRRGAPLSFSFCAQVVSTGEQLVVEDARKHPLLRHSTAIRELGWVAYAGVPLVTRDGQTVGSFSVVDKMPRLWSERDMVLLKDLAASVISEIELRRETARRRQAEQERREEEQFHSTFEQSGIGMAVISPDGRWLRVNQALCEMLGFSADNMIGFSAEAFSHPEDVAADREAVRLLLAGECRTYTIEKRYITRSGDVLWALVNVSLVADADGAPAHLIAAIQDVTERKQSEAALKASEERFRLVAQASREVVWDWDLLSDQVTWNPGTGPLLDYEPTELGTTADWWYERLHPEDRERVVRTLNAAMGQGQSAWFEEYRFRRADGGYADVQGRARIVHDETNAPVRVISAMADLTEGRRSEWRVQQVLDALPAAAWIVDRQGRIVLDNAASREVWGPVRDLELEQLAVFNVRWANSQEPVQLNEWGPALALRSSESATSQEMTIDVPEVGERTIVNSAVPIRDTQGHVMGVLNVTEDVTAQRIKEAGVRREELDRQLDKMDAIGRLAGGIAHDFNNLLTGILTYSELMLQELRPSDPLRSDIEQIRHAGQRAAVLTRQLLAFSRRQVLQPRAVSLNALITELQPMLERLLGPDVALDLLLDPAAGNVWVDPRQMEQVLVNLMVNARDAMPAGGRVSLTTGNVELESPYGVISVKDTGIGMDEVTQARIFEPFFTTKHGASGTGLGLSTVFGIVQQSGGRIEVNSQPGQGSEFTIYLPRYTGPEPAVSTAWGEATRGGTETLLLVEDEATVRASVRRLLEWHGYRVIEAGSGGEALRIYEEHPATIDLVLTDVAMPEMSGYELVERLRLNNPALPVVFMSGYSEEAPSGSGVMSFATRFLEKPFTGDLLMVRLREVLDAAR